MVESRHAVLNPSREVPARTLSGYLLLGLAVLLLAGAATSVWRLAGGHAGATEVAMVVLLVPALVFIAAGFYMMQPNEAYAITLFGAYRGTDRQAGLRWVLPWMIRKRISVRANNMVSERLKVNELGGSPVEIAAQLVWRVTDTAQALFDIDDYKAFVLVQTEAAVRAIGSRYPYDDTGDGGTSLRGHHEEVNAALRAELIARLAVAGITVDECGLTHLAYAPEIAQAMLRRQQAEAVVAARAKVVEGAVGMVEMALETLSARHVVELDDERRAAMVSNLMVVLCGDRDTQPVVNTGTLYQ